MTDCLVRMRGIVDYDRAAAEMVSFTDHRTDHDADQVWVLQHPPIFTQGTSCHSLPRQNPEMIPVTHTSRGGQITYHGPGQLIVYLMLDLKRLGIGPKKLVSQLEECLISLLNHYGIKGERKHKAPGVYVNDAKIAALGLRIRKGKCFHGFSLNVDMDLAPFDWIDPCGFPGLAVTQLRDHGVKLSLDAVSHDILRELQLIFFWDRITQSS